MIAHRWMLFGALLLCRAAAGQLKPELIHLYDYDAKAALDLKEGTVVDREGVKVHDITYASPKGGRVPAFLVVPPGQGPFAGIVFLHWGQGDRSSFLADALLFAQAGAVSLLIDAPFRRPNPPRGGFDYPEEERAGHIQAVVDVRRGVDLLAARPDVDPKRIAYVGHSYGASLGGAVRGVEKRLRAVVLMGGLPSWTEAYRSGSTPGGAEARRTLPPDKLKRYIEAIAPLDALNYIGSAGPPVFLQFARVDRFISEKAAAEYEEAAAPPKLVKWYDGGHELNDLAALRDRADWLRGQVGIGPLRAILEKKLGMR